MSRSRAGIGKSRLLAEVTARVGQEQAHFLHGACFEQDRALPFAPLVDVLRTLLLSPAREASLHLLAKFSLELIKLVPDRSKTVWSWTKDGPEWVIVANPFVVLQQIAERLSH